ncbi:MAG TPA: DUF5668 domain-containing protein [Candidatus Eisenbacteria bacterium]|nr:DUF5668 domain-containing protein [Candidatus Eisenbacteria bacterium]
MAETRRRVSAQLILGIVVVWLGLLFTLDNLGILESGPILRYWPVVLIVIGLTKLIGVNNRPQMIAGGLFTFIGLWLLLGNLNVIHVGIWDLWPLFFVIAGASLVVGSLRRQRETGSSSDASDYANAFVMMGGVGHKLVSSQFRGGEATAVMGGVELDLRNATAATPTVVIHVMAWWGGVEIRVPKDWQVQSEVLPIMAGYEDTTKSESEVKTQLVVKGLVVMGGVEVKN